MARGKAHDPETKAAVMAALLAGQGVNEIARDFKIPASVVSGWKNGLAEPEFELVRTVRTDKTGTLDTLLFEYLAANLKALKIQAEICSDPAYLKRYPPQQIAVLHGIFADKSVRLLEAAAEASEGEVDGAGPEEAPELA